MKEMILPEFNSSDEREAVITGKAAKDALSAILIFTPIAIATMALALKPDSGRIPAYDDFIDCFIHPDCRFDRLLLFISPPLFAIKI